MKTRPSTLVALIVTYFAQTLRGQEAEPGGLRPQADNVAIQDICRIQGQGESVLRGIGLITGLAKGKGDKGTEMALARPLAKFYESNGVPLPDLQELASASTCAVVALEVVIPAQGARQDDTLDIRVTVLHSAVDLTGGQLILSPLLGPIVSDTSVYAMGAGTISLEDKASLTSGVIRNGARMIADVPMRPITDSFVLTLQPSHRHYSVSTRIADAINGAVNDPAEGLSGGDRTIHANVAKALNDTSVLVTIPPAERSNVPQFVSMVMTTQVTLTLLQQPAEVRINQRTGSITLSGNVEISPVAISHRNLTINTLVPAAPPTVNNPLRVRENTVAIDTSGRPRDRAKVQDLLNAFKALDVPMDDRINILRQLHKTGRLHARLVDE